VSQFGWQTQIETLRVSQVHCIFRAGWLNYSNPASSPGGSSNHEAVALDASALCARAGPDRAALRDQFGPGTAARISGGHDAPAAGWIGPARSDWAGCTVCSGRAVRSGRRGDAQLHVSKVRHVVDDDAAAKCSSRDVLQQVRGEIRWRGDSAESERSKSWPES